jgi:hypothetical protein
MTAISAEAAMKRITQSGLTLEDAIKMSDSDLLRNPLIGRRTLNFIRAARLTEA